MLDIVVANTDTVPALMELTIYWQVEHEICSTKKM